MWNELPSNSSRNLSSLPYKKLFSSPIARKLENWLFYGSSLSVLPKCEGSAEPQNREEPRVEALGYSSSVWSVYPQSNEGGHVLCWLPWVIRMAFWSYLFSAFVLVNLVLSEWQTLKPNLVTDASVYRHSYLLALWIILFQAPGGQEWEGEENCHLLNSSSYLPGIALVFILTDCLPSLQKRKKKQTFCWHYFIQLTK